MGFINQRSHHWGAPSCSYPEKSGQQVGSPQRNISWMNGDEIANIWRDSPRTMAPMGTDISGDYPP